MGPRSVLTFFAALLLACFLAVLVLLVGFDALIWRVWLHLPRMPPPAIREAAAAVVAGAGVLALRYLLAGVPAVPRTNPQAGSSPAAPRRCFWVVCGLLAAAQLVPAPVAWRASEDVRNFVPLLVAIKTVVTLVYAFAYSAIAYLGRFRMQTVVVQHVAVGAIQIVHTLLFFLLERPMWGGPSAWRNHLTPLQSVVFHHATPWLVYACSLAVALIIAAAARRGSSSGSPSEAV